jgi:hypothetical protein
MKIILGNFNAELGRENIFKPTTGNESWYESSNENKCQICKLCHIKNLAVKSLVLA